MEFLFWFCVSCILYAYIGYYICLRVAASLFSRPIRRDDARGLPSVTVIVAAWNEEARVEARVKNLLELDYPEDKLEIMIGSDGSTDRTVEIATRYKDRGVVVQDFRENRGRAAVHNDCVKAAKGDVVVFTDAETIFDRGFLKHLARDYADDGVGAVVGSLSYVARDNEFASAEGFYFRYEKVLRGLESRIGILSSGTGACFSMRRAMYRDMLPMEDVDQAQPIHVVNQGARVVLEPEARAHDFPPGSVEGVMKARVRMTAQAFSCLARLCGPMFCLAHPLVAWTVVSRRFLRWLTGFFMLGALVTNVMLAGNGGVYMLTLGAQAAFYGLYLAGWTLNSMNRQARVPSWAFIFVTANIGMSLGVLKALAGKAPSSYKMPESAGNDEHSETK